MFQLVFLLLLFEHIFGGHYLFYLPFSSKSIKLGFMPMALDLAEKGHNITIVSPYQEEKHISGIFEIIHSSPFEALADKISENILRESVDKSGFPFSALVEATLTANHAALAHPDLQRILSDQTIAVDVLMTVPQMGNEAGYFIAHSKNATQVMFYSVPFLFPWMGSAVGNPLNPAYMPLFLFPFSQHMNFKERFINTLATLAVILCRKFYILPKVEAMLTQIFPNQTIPGLDELSKKTALTIHHGSPFTHDGLRPTMPNTIMAGFMGCAQEKRIAEENGTMMRPLVKKWSTSVGRPLVGELKAWVEGAEHGVIYLSFGSAVKSSKMPASRRRLLISVLGRLEQRVVWKWDQTIEDLPQNVKTFSWLPQADVLSHSNVKLFITHGGAGSVQETICHRTPVIGLPLMGDQITNLGNVVNKGLGIVINWADVTEDNLFQAIQKVLSEPEYKKAVEAFSDLVLDTAVPPRKLAVWWLEYLLRHPHNPGMRSPVLELNWAQYMLLDVLCVLLLIPLILLFLLMIIKNKVMTTFASRKRKHY